MGKSWNSIRKIIFIIVGIVVILGAMSGENGILSTFSNLVKSFNGEEITRRTTEELMNETPNTQQVAPTIGEEFLEITKNNKVTLILLAIVGIIYWIIKKKNERREIDEKIK